MSIISSHTVIHCYPLQVKFFKNSFQDPTFFAQVPMQVAAEREIARYYWQQVRRQVGAHKFSICSNPSLFDTQTSNPKNLCPCPCLCPHPLQSNTPGELNWTVSTSQFAHPTVATINIVGQAMGPFVFAANMFNFVLLVRAFETRAGLCVLLLPLSPL